MGWAVRLKNSPGLSNPEWNIPLAQTPYFLIKADPVGKFPLPGPCSLPGPWALGPGVAPRERTRGQAVSPPHRTPTLSLQLLPQKCSTALRGGSVTVRPSHPCMSPLPEPPRPPL